MENVLHHAQLMSKQLKKKIRVPFFCLYTDLEATILYIRAYQSPDSVK